MLRLHEESGCQRFIVHSRKALLSGLPPAFKQLPLDEEAASGRAGGAGFVTTRQNRLQELVPLRYDFPQRLRRELPASCKVELNGGVRTIADIRRHLGLPHDVILPLDHTNSKGARGKKRSGHDRAGPASSLAGRCVSLCLSVSLFLCVCVCLGVCLCLCLSVCVSVSDSDSDSDSDSSTEAQPLVGMDGVMLGRIARDRPFFFSRIDSEVFGEPTDPLESPGEGGGGGGGGGRGEWDGRLRLLEAYASYANEEQRSGREPSRCAARARAPPPPPPPPHTHTHTYFLPPHSFARTDLTSSCAPQGDAAEATQPGVRRGGRVPALYNAQATHT
eukprot:COSAG03_NODE_45_length_16899_cov_157.747202_4_plen_332_part_00